MLPKLKNKLKKRKWKRDACPCKIGKSYIKHKGFLATKTCNALAQFVSLRIHVSDFHPPY